MNKIYFTAFLICFTLFASAQYCTVSSAVSYSPDMPGIAQFMMSNVSRTSAALECTHPCNSYVNTGLTVYLEAGKKYPVSINHTKDPVNFPNARNNLRIWIDYNHNNTLDDSGETALSLNLQPVGLSMDTIMIPANAQLGSTRMRVTAKMSADAGHAIPTPCDSPADPIGYHGEIEDYTAVIVPLGTLEHERSRHNAVVYPNPFRGETSIAFSLDQPAHVQAEVFDLSGKLVETLAKAENLQRGAHELRWRNASAGIYLLKLQVNESVQWQRLLSVE